MSSAGIRSLGRMVLRDAASTAIVLFTALMIGLGLNNSRRAAIPVPYIPNEIRPRAGSFSNAGDAATPRDGASLPQETIALDEFEALARRKDTLIVDARPGPSYHRGHIPGALSLPRGEIPAEYAKAYPALRPARPKAILVYCEDASCDDSKFVADALASLGFRNVFRFPGGWAEWRSGGKPETRSAP